MLDMETSPPKGLDPGSSASEERDQRKKRQRSTSADDALKKRLWTLFKTVNEYQV